MLPSLSGRRAGDEGLGRGVRGGWTRFRAATVGSCPRRLPADERIADAFSLDGGDSAALDRAFRDLLSGAEEDRPRAPARQRAAGPAADRRPWSTTATSSSRRARTRLRRPPHFFAYASRVLRSIVVDVVREQRALRRGGDARDRDARHGGRRGSPPSVDIEALNDALEDLAKSTRRSPAWWRCASSRDDRGEVAAAIDVSARTVSREGQKARACCSPC